jgi:hypothetical protein
MNHVRDRLNDLKKFIPFQREILQMSENTEKEFEETNKEFNLEPTFQSEKNVELVTDFDPERRKLAIAYTRT